MSEKMERRIDAMNADIVERQSCRDRGAHLLQAPGLKRLVEELQQIHLAGHRLESRGLAPEVQQQVARAEQRGN
ncbi:MAG TPA: hypothetical protein VFE62_23870 [Gemmataceae bacterium]|nr:hypothetical protein [Gemmataceae bacterium]